MDALLAAIGKEKAKRVVNFGRAAVAHVKALISEYKIDADVEAITLRCAASIDLLSFFVGPRDLLYCYEWMADAESTRDEGRG